VKKATLALACGETFEGFACGAKARRRARWSSHQPHRLQEILTDPSYAGQLVTSPSPSWAIGVHHGDEQSDAPQVAGFIARRVSREPSNWRSDESLPGWLARHGIVGIEGIDTRRLVRVLRSSGAQQGIIDSSGLHPQPLVERARRLPGMEGRTWPARSRARSPTSGRRA